MPTYEYRCAKCDQHIEVYQSFSESPLTKHDGCGGKLTKVLSPAGIVLKGSGFYKTDSRSAAKSRSGGKSKDTGDGKSTGSAGESSKESSKESSSKESSSDSSKTTSTPSGGAAKSA